MAEIKTKKTTESASAFIAKVEDPARRADGTKLLALFKKTTGMQAKVWGNTTSGFIGFGQYHYKSERSSQEGDWPLTGFSPRKQNLTVYVMPGFKRYGPLLKKLGKHKVSGGSCIYINKLEDVDLKVLAEIVKTSVRDMRKKYKV